MALFLQRVARIVTEDPIGGFIMAARRKKRSGSTRTKAGGAVSLDRIRSAVAEQQLGWEAAPTPLSALSAEERRSRLGLRVDPKEMRATEEAVRAAERL